VVLVFMMHRLTMIIPDDIFTVPVLLSGPWGCWDTDALCNRLVLRMAAFIHRITSMRPVD
jgi:hypothetical protein